MTITVTVEELAAYSAACEKWWSQRGIVFGEALVRCGSVDYRAFTGATSLSAGIPEALKAVDAWEKKNPYPRLIPQI